MCQSEIFPGENGPTRDSLKIMGNDFLAVDNFVQVKNIFFLAEGWGISKYIDNISEDCQEFKKQCQDVCINKSVDIWANECWGDPLYVECKCSDESVHKIPGFTCKNSECPPEFKQKPIPNRTRTRGKFLCYNTQCL